MIDISTANNNDFSAGVHTDYNSVLVSDVTTNRTSHLSEDVNIHYNSHLSPHITIDYNSDRSDVTTYSNSGLICDFQSSSIDNLKCRRSCVAFVTSLPVLSCHRRLTALLTHFHRL